MQQSGEEMFKVYKESDVSNPKTVQTIKKLVELAYEKAKLLVLYQ